MLSYLEKLKNTGTIIALGGLVGSLLIQFGFNFDSETFNNIIKIICNILVILGICNNPTTSGLDLPVSTTSEVEAESSGATEEKITE